MPVSVVEMAPCLGIEALALIPYLALIRRRYNHTRSSAVASGTRPLRRRARLGRPQTAAVSGLEVHEGREDEDFVSRRTKQATL